MGKPVVGEVVVLPFRSLALAPKLLSLTVADSKIRR